MEKNGASKMFRNILDALTKNPLLDEAYRDLDRINHLTQEMFIMSRRALIDQEVPPKEVQIRDKKVNSLVQIIRKKVFEYLSINSSPNIHAGLVIISLVIDYERIGDYTKDIALMREEFDYRDDFRPYIKDHLEKMEDIISLMFLESHKAIEESEGKASGKVSELEESLKEEYNLFKSELLEKGCVQNESLTGLVTARILKRIAAHHDNISSAAVRPFPKLGFKPGSSQWKDD